MTPHAVPGRSSSGYWYDSADSTVAMLSALRRFRRADHGMRRELSRRMKVNATDLEAIQHITAHERAGSPLTAHRLTALLQISTAATAKLLNRLTTSGHIIRRPNSDDRRSILIVPTDHAHEELSHWLSPMHQGMLKAAHAVPEESRQAVIDFLDAVADALDSVGADGDAEAGPG